MDLAMVSSAKPHGELVADPETKSAGLRKAQMVSIDPPVSQAAPEADQLRFWCRFLLFGSFESKPSFFVNSAFILTAPDFSR